MPRFATGHLALLGCVRGIVPAWLTSRHGCPAPARRPKQSVLALLLVRLLATLTLSNALPLPGADSALHVPVSHEYSLREWHVSDGLPHDEVSRVHQDAHGFLWVATFEGLTRFDSVHFENFADRMDAGTASPWVRAIAEPAGLGLICAPSDGGILALRDGSWHRLPIAAGRVINSFFTASDGTLWASCEDRTLLRHHAGRTESFSVADLGSDRPIAYFASDGDNQLWIATGSFFGRYEDGRLVRGPAIPNGVELRIGSSRTGGPWIITRTRIHKMVDGVPDAGVPIPALVGAHYIHTLHEDRTGALWIGTRSQGLFRFADGKLVGVPASSEDIRSLCEDREGNLWVGTNGGGLDRLRQQKFQLFDKAAGLRDHFSHSVCEDAAGTIWFANRDGGVARFRNGQVEVLGAGPGWRPFNAMSIIPDGQGKIWITGGLGIYQIDPADQDRLIRPAGMPLLKLVRASYVARNGDYWMSIDPDRVGRMSGGKFTAFGASEGMTGQRIRCLSEDSKGRLWVGTTDGKVFRFNGERFEQIPLESDAPLGPIQALCFETDDVLWIGTYRTGLGVLSGGRFQTFGTRRGFPDDRITDIIRDDRGRFWFGSTLGVFSVPGEALSKLRAGTLDRVQAHVIGRDDSIAGLACLGMFKPSTWKDRSGRLWFATRKGVLMFDPETVTTDITSPPVFISELKFDDHRRPLVDPLKISARVRKTEFRLSVLRFSAPDRVQIKYRLEGFDSEWVVANPDRLVTYPALPPGEYRFRAVSSLSNGVWNEDGVSLAITVVPLWWQSLWFYLLLGATIVTAIVLIVRTWAHRRLRQRVERLEREGAIERERTRIARDIHDDVGASLSRISLLTQSAQQGSASEPSPHLGQIYATVSEITRSMDEIVWAVNPRHDLLDGLAGYLASYAQTQLGVAGIRCRLNLPDQLPAVHLSSHVRHNLYLCLKETLNNVVKHSGADEVLIAMSVGRGEFNIVVSDNGRGFDVDHPAQVASDRLAGGNGLGNMRRRMEEVSGRCEIQSDPSSGTRLSFSVPLAKTANG